MANERRASCRCGQLSLVCVGEPVRVSVCHCHACQKRSGSAFAVQARFETGAVTIAGEARVWKEAGDSGAVAAFHFCPVCGATVYYQAEAQPGLIAVAVGAFADSAFPPPSYSVYETRKHRWLEIVGDGIDHIA